MYNSKTYGEDLDFVLKSVNLDFFKNKSILITGANGLICSYLVDALIYANENFNSNITIYALSRSEEKLKERFKEYCNREYFHPVIQDVCEKIEIEEPIDCIIHGASPATPKLYIQNPVDTMNANYLGMLNILNYASKNPNSKTIYISSSEIYGKNNEETGKELSEEEYKYVDILEVRSSYASSKRASETLCIAFKNQYNCNVCIARPAHIYGPTMTNNDSRAVSDFLRNVSESKDIVMKSDGSSVRSYCYVGDAVTGIMKIIEKGISGEAYNISNSNEIISIKELATTIAKLGNKELIMDIPQDDLNKKINSNNKEIRISSSKLENLGWKCQTTIEKGISKSLKILKEKH